MDLYSKIYKTMDESIQAHINMDFNIDLWKKLKPIDLISKINILI